jgi:hypothetical protein
LSTRDVLGYPLYFALMNVTLAQQIVATYEKHGWKLRRLLLRSATGNESQQIGESFPSTPIVEAEIDAVWFARASHAGREAWELRLVAEQPYALFEAFEPDETEEDREEARREMENRVREYATGAVSKS